MHFPQLYIVFWWMFGAAQNDIRCVWPLYFPATFLYRRRCLCCLRDVNLAYAFVDHLGTPEEKEKLCVIQELATGGMLLQSMKIRIQIASISFLFHPQETSWWTSRWLSLIIQCRQSRNATRTLWSDFKKCSIMIYDSRQICASSL